MQKEMLQAHYIMGIIYNVSYFNGNFDFELFQENRKKLGDLICYSNSVDIPLSIIQTDGDFIFYLLREESPLIDPKSNVLVECKLPVKSGYRQHTMAELNRILTDLQQLIETNVILKKEASTGFSQYDMRENYEDYVSDEVNQFDETFDIVDDSYIECNEEDNYIEELDNEDEERPLW